jgi:signal transduction histidine kinase
VTAIPENPRERHLAVTERLRAIAAEQARLRDHEAARQAHLQRTLPELEQALQALHEAEERVRIARAEHGAAGTMRAILPK